MNQCLIESLWQLLSHCLNIFLRGLSKAGWLWIPLWIYLVFVALVLGLMNGCGSRTVLVQEGSPIRLGPNCKVWIYTLQNQEWHLSAAPVTIPEGWYCVPPSYVSEIAPLIKEN